MASSFWWGVGIGFLAGFFVFTAVGRELITTPAMLAERKVREKLAEKRKGLSD